jgi:hypothetical protein
MSSTAEGLCRLPLQADAPCTAASLVADLGRPGAMPPLAWCALGPPALAVYLPVSLEGDLPAAFEDPRHGCLWRRLRRIQPRHASRSALSGLQGHFDQLALEFETDAALLRDSGHHDALHRLATAFMEHALERLDNALLELTPAPLEAVAH